MGLIRIATGWWIAVLGMGACLGHDRCQADEPDFESASRSDQQVGTALQVSYHDDADGRVLADVQLRIQKTFSRSQLRAEISPVGPMVSPPPGYRSIQGTNYITAGQLRYLLVRESNGLTAQVVNDDERALTASIGVEQWGRLRERRLLPTGQIDYLAKSVDLYPMRVA